jgi:hypothetical protein
MAHDPFEFDVALSFAGEDKAIAEKLAKLLTARNRTVFLDMYTTDSLWAKNILDHLVNLYARKARYCVLLISHHYPLKSWTKAERRQVQERGFRDVEEYILPFSLDDTLIPGLGDMTADRELIQPSIGRIAELLDHKLASTARPPGSPLRSHDLRSGNVPPAHPEGEET